MGAGQGGRKGFGRTGQAVARGNGIARRDLGGKTVA